MFGQKSRRIAELEKALSNRERQLTAANLRLRDLSSQLRKVINRLQY